MKKVLFLFLMAAIVTSCNNNGGSSSSSTSSSDSTLAAMTARDSMIAKNKQLALNSIQAYNDKNVDGIFQDMAPGFVDYGDGSAPQGTSMDSMKAGAKMFLAAFPDNKGSIFQVIADSNHAAIFAVWTGTFKNPFMGIKPTGKSYKINDVDLFTFNSAGQIISHRNITPNSVMYEQVGMKMKK